MMGIVGRLLVISVLVGICCAVNGTPQDKAPAQLEPRMTEMTKLSDKIKSAAAAEGDDCSDPPPRRCRWWQAPHDPSDPNSPGWVRATPVGMGQLPDDLKAKMPKWIKPNQVRFLPEEPAATGEGGPCCMCPQCGLSFYTPNDYWGHIVSCPVPRRTECPPQTNPCTGDSHYDSDPRLCMCVKGRISSSAPLSALPVSSSGAAAPSGGSDSGASGVSGASGASGASNSASVNALSSSAEEVLMALNGSLIVTGSIGEPLTGGGVPFMLEYEDIQQIGEQIGEQVAEAIENGNDGLILGA